MNVTVEIEINKPKEIVWQTITDFENCSDVISAIINLTVLHRPETGLVGFKWQETRMMFGKESSETMWITEAVENEFYITRAESHGAVYTTRLSLTETADGCSLNMSFSSEAQTFIAKVMSCLLGPLMKGSIKKCLYQDLLDIKDYVEAKAE